MEKEQIEKIIEIKKLLAQNGFGQKEWELLQNVLLNFTKNFEEGKCQKNIIS